MKNQIVYVLRFVRPTVYGAVIVYSVLYSSGYIRRWDLSKKCRDTFSVSYPWYTCEIIKEHLSYLPHTVSDFIIHNPVSWAFRSDDSCQVLWE